MCGLWTLLNEGKLEQNQFLPLATTNNLATLSNLSEGVTDDETDTANHSSVTTDGYSTVLRSVVERGGCLYSVNRTLVQYGTK